MPAILYSQLKSDVIIPSFKTNKKLEATVQKPYDFSDIQEPIEGFQSNTYFINNNIVGHGIQNVSETYFINIIKIIFLFSVKCSYGPLVVV